MLEGDPGEISSIGRHTHRLEDNIKMSLKPGARMCTAFIWPGIKYSNVFLLTDECSVSYIWLISSKELSSSELVPAWNEIQGCFKQNAEFRIDMQIELWGIPLTFIHVLP
jgi:hypothetical protein